jgi:hypothetical protein
MQKEEDEKSVLELVECCRENHHRKHQNENVVSVVDT